MAFHSYTDNYRQVNAKLTVEFHVLVDTEIVTSFGSTAKYSNKRLAGVVYKPKTSRIIIIHEMFFIGY